MSFEDLILRLELSTERLNKGFARLEAALSQKQPAWAEFKNTLRHVKREDDRQLDKAEFGVHLLLPLQLKRPQAR